MSYQEMLKKSLVHSNIKYLILYSVLALLCCGGALSGLNGGETVKVLDLLPLSTQVTGTIFLALFILMLILLVRTVRAAFSGKAYRDLCENVRTFGNPETVFNYLGTIPKSEYCAHGDFRCDKKYMAFVLDDTFLIRPTHQILWGFLQEEANDASRHNRAFRVSAGGPPVVTLVLEDLRTVTLRARSKTSAEKLLAAVKEVNPQMAVGFTEKNASIYRQNPKNLRSTANIPDSDKTPAAKQGNGKKEQQRPYTGKIR